MKFRIFVFIFLCICYKAHAYFPNDLPERQRLSYLETDEGDVALRIKSAGGDALIDNLTVSNSLSIDHVNFVNYLDFNIEPGSIEHNEGRFHWNEDDGTLELGLQGGTAILQLGQELHQRAKNGNGSLINNGDVIYISGSSGSRMEVNLASDSVCDDKCTFAVATEDIGVGQNGYATFFGLVRDISTSGLNEGEGIYVSSTLGELTSNMPTDGDLVVKIGTCIVKHGTEGQIFVNPSIHLWQKPDGFIESYNDVQIDKNLSVLEDLTVNGYIDSQNVYGCLFTYEDGLSQNLTTADTYYVVEGWTANGSNKTILNENAGTITVNVDGLYQISGNISLAADKVCIIHGDVWINGVDSERFSFRRKISTTNQYGNMSTPTQFINLNSGDYIDLRLYSDTANTTISVDHGGISLLKIGKKDT